MAMATQETEKISALLDGELPYTEGKRMLNAVLNQSEERDRLSRYQAYSACMRGESIGIDHAQLFDRIHQQLADEPAILAPNAIPDNSRFGLKRLVSGSAIAAGVAAVVIIGANNLVPTGESPTLASQAPRPVTLSPQIVAESSDSAASATINSYNNLDSYLREHEDMLGSGSLGTGLPLATMVGYGGF